MAGWCRVKKLTLPYPPKELNPNKKLHWAQKAKIVKSYKAACFALTRESGIKVGTGRVKMSIEFIKPDNRKRDDDNIIASFKAGRDGVAWALGVDDFLFDVTYRVSGETCDGGAVVVWFDN